MSRGIICNQCKKCGECGKPYSSNSTYAEICKDFEKKKMTNYEKIKSMSVEDMAEMFLDESENHYTYCNHCSHQSFYAPHCTSNNLRIDCVYAVKKWLESEVEE